jgi:ABC-type nitrate/sulfonate/bicarbonate transport system substrate-binding protein
MALEPFGSSMIAEGRAFALVDFRSEADVRQHLGSTYPLTALLVRQDLIDRDPAAVQALTDAIVWASKWLAQAEAADVEKLLPPGYISEPEVWRRSLAGYRDTFSADGSIDVEGIHAVVEAQAAFDPRFDPRAVDVTALYTERFWNISNVKPVGGDPSREPTQPPAAPTATEGRDIDPLVLGSAVALVLVASAALLWIWRRRGR